MSVNENLPVIWNANKVRDTFYDYFKSKNHTFISSSPVVPYDDPTLLFANAGMNQFKSIFLGTVDPTSKLYDLKRAYNSQKCIRAGGKHNDLEDVGKDSYHHTYFEMLGNWSFGDYFKNDAIVYSWDLLTNVYKIPKDRLYVSYFEGDESQGLEPDFEARDIWRSVGVPEDHIVPGNLKDNFWEMGEEGPCGPSSEIHYDRIGGRNASQLVNKDDPNVLEIWNLVFIQYNRDSERKLKALPAKHVDTGMGFERLVSVLQNVNSNYDIDLFTKIFKRIQAITNAREYTGKFGKYDVDGVDTAYRVLADHARTLTFALTDGCIPNNEGRGYVIRRILRRGARYARKYMNYSIGDFFSKLIPQVIEENKSIFPEVSKDFNYIKEILDEEEASFAKTLDRGEKLFEKYASDASKLDSKTLDGLQVWRLYDTYGFPVDLTELMAQELGLNIDVPGFERAKKDSYEASKRASKKYDIDLFKLDVHDISKLNTDAVPKTNDKDKYETTDVMATVLRIHDGSEFLDVAADKDKKYGVILDKTCFYAEQGGQIYDNGKLIIDGKTEFNVENVQEFNGYILHIGTLMDGKLSTNDKVVASFDELRRFPIRNNHTGTHILNFALRDVLGKDVEQKGSLVTPEKFRFDFSHKKPLTLDEIKEIEMICDTLIVSKKPVFYKNVQLNEAKRISSIRAVFGESYPDPVRVVSIGQPVEKILEDPTETNSSEFSIEFCGGTHVANTEDIQKLAIIEETGIAKGIRRITAVTGPEAFNAQRIAEQFNGELDDLNSLPFSDAKDKKIKELGFSLNQSTVSVLSKHLLREKFNKIEKKYKEELRKKNKLEAKVILDKVQEYFNTNKSSKFFVYAFDIPANSKAITDAINYIKNSNNDKSIYLLSGDIKGNKLAHGCYLSDDAISKGIDGEELVKVVTTLIGGKAGGRKNIFQGVSTYNDNINEVIDNITKIFSEKLT
ncbi:hypothetical protein Kpol_1071p9 [Vanderwaltozyma polyspora DSM 70294]|uniref:Alanine--tRNA ligase n=1 Tax=Vanderwaltozyma polyspora (strain ATCC 22028 / DSM 70294 / BCRC 21397 / CBS 2163 / NBRC 10782 / NRRL Y-8283 / UCD 57-17) TaxID=436907 RepID=A7TRK4_VANPO|nr:uncharacterized protein Kpol_1071p9 [Vanderwaltozyma polyspora DSM 70294]EDO15102.1 hypothetical protein Kpol_1071p9 [Vanderwaltozyma polyspora DSM 70294]